MVCEHLPAADIHGTDYCDRFVETVLLRARCGWLDDGSTVPIVRRPLKSAGGDRYNGRGLLHSVENRSRVVDDSI